eukprot:2183529-Pyramimonas_sp.AAC.3
MSRFSALRRQTGLSSSQGPAGWERSALAGERETRGAVGRSVPRHRVGLGTGWLTCEFLINGKTFEGRNYSAALSHGGSGNWTRAGQSGGQEKRSRNSLNKREQPDSLTVVDVRI